MESVRRMALMAVVAVREGKMVDVRRTQVPHLLTVLGNSSCPLALSAGSGQPK